MTAQMQGNPHIIRMRSTPMTDGEAQIEATLALAFEQRTANLIAAFGQLGEGDVSTYLGDAIGAVEDMGGKKLAHQIAERLGLK